MLKVRSFLALSILAIIAGCSGGYNGQLLGVLDRPEWNTIIPYGMVYIPSGTLHIGQNDEDMNNSLFQPSKSISIQGFFMDETEITNNEYRQFVYWVRDSIAHILIGGEHIINEGEPNQRINWRETIDWEDESIQETLTSMYVPSDRKSVV